MSIYPVRLVDFWLDRVGSRLVSSPLFPGKSCATATSIIWSFYYSRKSCQYYLETSSTNRRHKISPDWHSRRANDNRGSFHNLRRNRGQSFGAWTCMGRMGIYKKWSVVLGHVFGQYARHHFCNDIYTLSRKRRNRTCPHVGYLPHLSWKRCDCKIIWSDINLYAKCIYVFMAMLGQSSVLEAYLNAISVTNTLSTFHRID